MAAWIVIGIGEPVALLAALVIGAALGVMVNSGYPISIWEQRLVLLLLVIAPTAALPLAFQAARWGSRSGKVALGVSAVLLAATLAFDAYAGWLLEWVIPWVLLSTLLISLMLIFGKKPSQPVHS